MPAARFWRLIAFDPYAGGDLALSEVALFEGASRVDGAATVSATIAPSSGTLSSLSDSSFSTSVMWAGSLVGSSGFALVWDFGAGVTKDITKVGLASPSRDMAAALASLQYSTDGGSTWASMGAAAFAYIDATTLATTDDFDATFGDVTLLLHMDGSNGGTSFPDSSLANRTPANVNVVTTVTEEKKYGTASAYFSALSTQTFEYSGFQFGTSDFTVELWARASKGSQTNPFPRLLSRGTYPNNGSFALVYIKSSGSVFFDFCGSSVIGVFCGDLNDNEWTHIAISRVSGVARTFKNGVLQATVTAATNLNITSNLYLGRENIGPGFFRGNMDELRITQGVGRYTAGFSPPGKPYFDGRPAPDMPMRTQSSDVTIVGDDVPGETQPAISAPTSPIDIYDAGRGRITGPVKEKNTPANTPLKRRVVLLSMPGSRAIRETWSDPVTGVYEFTEVATDRVYVVVSYDHTGIYRGVVADNLTPELMT